MAYLVCITEDQPETRSDIVKAVVDEVKDINIIQVANPWNLIDELRKREIDKHPQPGLVIADLYIPGYWSQSPKSACGKRIKPNVPATTNNPQEYKNAVLDTICNYLEEIEKNYRLKLIIYSHIFIFLKKFAGGGKMIAEIKEELKKVQVSENDIVEKTREETCQVEEMKMLIAKIREAQHAVK